MMMSKSKKQLLRLAELANVHRSINDKTPPEVIATWIGQSFESTVRALEKRVEEFKEVLSTLEDAELVKRILAERDSLKLENERLKGQVYDHEAIRAELDHVRETLAPFCENTSAPAMASEVAERLRASVTECERCGKHAEGRFCDHPDCAGITVTKTVHELIASNDSPLPLEVIPNYMGINLVSVRALTWTRREDGQLVDLTIHFVPEGARDERPFCDGRGSTLAAIADRDHSHPCDKCNGTGKKQ